MEEAAAIVPAVIRNENHLYYRNTELQEYVSRYGIVIESWYPFGGNCRPALLPYRAHPILTGRSGMRTGKNSRRAGMIEIPLRKVLLVTQRHVVGYMAKGGEGYVKIHDRRACKAL